ncbi:DUF3592 domain-containing protein [Pseudonocardia nantongensis]|uniref:DUF3592 domain-containing protein n=1 Tax=Pseudonocardia nantongensis TaxID=1181885 RepID=UPI00397D5AA1
MTSPTTSPTEDVLTESRAAAGRILAALRRRVPEIVLGVGVVWTLLALIALGGAALDDARISANQATTAATVLDGSDYWRTVVRYVDGEGRLQTPGAGISYPVGLTPGQNLYVEYDSTEPTRVRVAGRNAVDGILPTLGGIAAGWVLVAPVYLVLRRRRERTQQG